MKKINRYKKSADYSYTLGAFPTIELIEKNPSLLQIVYISDRYYERDSLMKRLRKLNIDYQINNKMVRKLANKGNTLVVGVFKKFENDIEDGNHIVLNEVSDMGNLGTIIRTMVGFGLKDLVLVGNVADIFNPKTVRASMGSIFDIRFRNYDKIEEYLEDFPDREIYLFMLSKDMKDSIYKQKARGKYSLVFGNEGAGLPDYYQKFGKRVFIPQTDLVDSLNLTIAVAIGIYEFGRKD